VTARVEVRRGAYFDSVSLMQVSRSVAEVAGVQAALVAMATPLNLDLLAELEFDAPAGAEPNDLVIAIRAGDEDTIERAMGELERGLRGMAGRGRPGGDLGAAPAAKTIREASRRVEANLALISVPGRYAFAEAADALEAGLNVMVFSDNVPVWQEVALKQTAAERGLLVMGPDCGTAVIGGVGLGFANALRRGRVGIVAASGTGAQQMSCLLDYAGVGVSHLIGVGGRDLSDAVGGRSTLDALAALDADPATELIVVVSKPPAAQVAQAVRQAAGQLSTPVVFALLGPGQPDLTAVAEHVITLLGGQAGGWFERLRASLPAAGALRGLFAGGTLCDEAMVIAADALGQVRSNIPLRPEWGLPDDLRGTGHIMIDFGDDRLTQGRPHPMIDPSFRLRRLAAEARDPECSVLLLDVILGYGADQDPAATLSPAIADARQAARRAGRDLAVVISLCGTLADPQGFDRQAGLLHEAGASIHLSNAAAARRAVALAQGQSS
jgi:FdrA protein